ncbi:MAG: serine hydrolase domain-containing protein [Pseudomonadota bacterium]
MQYLLALVALGVSIALQASGAASPLDDFIASELDAASLPGVSYAIVDNGTTVSGAQGIADLRTGKALAPDTPFQLASISKSFTAIAILQLVETGDVALEGELSLYLDDFRDSPAGAISIRQLLSHTSGYSTRQGNDTHVDRPESKDALSRQVERIARWSPAYAPGSRWDYSNANYVLLGAVIETMSGLKYDQYVETNIIEPIGMRNSFVGDGGTYDSVAIGHKPWFGHKRPAKDRNTKTVRAGAPAGGVIASADDLALYLQTLLNGEDDIISAEHKALMMQPANEQSPYYGLGWMLNPQDGTVYHTGTNPGTETLAILQPEAGKAVVVLVNAGSGMGFGETGNLINRISAYGLGRDFLRDESSWGRKSLFLTFALLPLIFLIGTVQAWRRRSGLRAKSGASGAFSLWFPVLVTSVLAWVSYALIPGLFGVSLNTLGIFSPDLAIALFATAVTGLIWSVFRLFIFYGGRVRT